MHTAEPCSPLRGKTLNPQKEKYITWYHIVKKQI